MVPASARDLDQSVDFLKDILKNETRTRSPGNFDNPISKLPTRSFHADTARGAGGRQDATVYKHNDDHTPPGGVYQPRSRHIDRDTVRTRSDDPTDDLSVMKRQLENTAKLLDRTAEESATRTREDDELEREMSDLRYRIKRLQDDLDYVSRGPRSYAKDDERRKLERELLHLMHEKLPDLEKRIEENQARKDREKREQTRDRDRRNDRFGRFSDHDDDYSRRYDDEDRYRNSYSGDRSRERDRPRDDYNRRDYDRRDRDRDFGRNRDDARDSDYRQPPPQDARTPPPPPPNPPSNSVSQLPPPPPPPPPSSTPANMAKMTKEERQVYIKAEAQRQIQERMKALGVTTSASSPSLDSSIADRLTQEKREAEEKAKAAEKAEEERARARQERLANEKAIKEGKSFEPPPPAPAPAPAPTISSPAKPPAPPPPKTRARPPPPPTKPSRPTAPPVPIPPTPVISEPPPPPQPNPEEERIKRLEEESRKRKEAMQARLRALEEEEEASRKAEAEIEKRRQALSNRTPIESPPMPAPPPPPPQPVELAVQIPAPPVPVSPPTPEPPKTAPTEMPSFNPFSRIKKEESSTTIVPSPPVNTGGNSTNPFFRSQTAPPPVAPAPPPSISPAPKPYYNTADDDTDEDWGEVVEKDEDDSSDDEFTGSRAKRTNLAEKFFGNILPPVRPQSAGPTTFESPRTPVSAPATSGVAPPPPPPGPVDDIPPPPGPPPPPPPGPPPPTQTSAPLPQPTEGRGALLSAIQGGARLRKAVTNDRSGSAISGRIIGDAAPPAHIHADLDSQLEPSFSDSFNPPSMSSEGTKNNHRLSVDWYAGLAADHGASHTPTLPSMREEEEDTAPANTIPQPVFNVQDADEPGSTDLMDDVDRSVGKCAKIV